MGCELRLRVIVGRNLFVTLGHNVTMSLVPLASSALVRKAVQVLSTRAYKRARVTGSSIAGSLARKGAEMAVRRIQRAYRARSARSARSKRARRGSTRTASRRYVKRAIQSSKGQKYRFDAYGNHDIPTNTLINFQDTGYPATTPNRHWLNTIDVGDIYNQREGDKVCLKGIHVRMIFRNVTPTGNVLNVYPKYVRLFLLSRKQGANGADTLCEMFKPTTDNSPEGFSSANVPVGILKSSHPWDKRGVKIIWEKRFMLAGTGGNPSLGTGTQNAGNTGVVKDHMYLNTLIKFKHKIFRWRTESLASTAGQIYPDLRFLCYISDAGGALAETTIVGGQFYTYWCNA